ncbi:MFS transporter [Bacillus sp. CLL-7-23]|uniref:MFS transporter n=1 Tax=Bacillus changyiensis TaxID=3004103 RepID=A0ABT4X600_9BACI|nr:MFS transporter [Bacillus changyiensis]MDA7027722.1 MFS transporter [Bacillus changyiensis]
MKSIYSSKKRVLSVVMVAIFTDMLMYGLVVPFLPIYAETLGASQSKIGLLFASYAIALLISTPIFGAIADRVGRKKLLVFGLVSLAMTTMVYALAFNFWVLVLARFLQGVAASIPWTAGLSLLAENFPQEERGKAMGTAMSSQAGGVLLGPLLGGWLYEWGGYQAPFFIAVGIALIAAILSIVFLRNVNDSRAENFSSPFHVLRRKQVLMIVGVAVIGSAVFASIEPTLPIHLYKHLNVSPGVIGTMFIVVTLAYGLSAPLIGAFSTRFGYVKTMMVGVVLVAVTLPLNALPTQLWLQIVTLAMLGISLGIVLTPALPKLAEISDQAGVVSQGVTFAVYNTGYSFGMMMGPLLASGIAGSFGLKMAYLTLSVIFLIYLIPLNRLKS